MEKAWNPICPDSEVPGLTVGDPIPVDGATVTVEQNANPTTLEGFGLDMNK
ncbi:hypothetical protein P261_01609 [Lachnospiraceae bacterium TWA4]|nr:hypothetical protein P261_01609 [Lachnospiraceae bacterium TWA4]